MKATRESYGLTLAELGETNENIVVLDADLSGSTKTAIFGKKFPDRFFNCGIAEGNMMSVAAGLAATTPGYLHTTPINTPNYAVGPEPGLAVCRRTPDRD